MLSALVNTYKKLSGYRGFKEGKYPPLINKLI